MSDTIYLHLTSDKLNIYLWYKTYTLNLTLQRKGMIWIQKKTSIQVKQNLGATISVSITSHYSQNQLASIDTITNNFHKITKILQNIQTVNFLNTVKGALSELQSLFYMFMF